MKKNKPLTESISITVCNIDHAKRKPFCVVIKKAVLIILAIVFLMVLATGVYAGISAYLSVDKLNGAMDDLKALIEYQALAQNNEDFEAESQSSFDWIDLVPISGDEISAEESPDSARMSDPFLEVEATTAASSVELLSGSVNSKVELISWFEEGLKLFPRFTEAVVIDVETGISFDVRRVSGTYHADSEPLTSGDTAVLKKLYGGKWSWDRRAIWLKIDERYIAASMNGMPHSSNYTSSNNFSGHFCIHFYRSRVHETSAQCPVHQSKVIDAFSRADLLDEYLKTNNY